MATRIGSVLQRGIDALNSGLGSPTIVWSGATLPCVPHQSDASRQLDAGGLANSIAISFVVDLDDVGSVLPKARQFVTYGADTYQIDNVKKSPCGSHLVLDCVHPDRGARVG